MRTLSENQIKVLKLYRKGKKPSEICELTNLSSSSVHEAIKRGSANIYRAIAIIETAMKNDILAEPEIRKLKQLLNS